MAVREFPWHALESISRRNARLAARTRQALGAADGRTVGSALSELLGGDVEVVMRDLGRARLPPGAREIVVHVEGRGHFGVALEPDGVHALLSKALGRPLGLPREGELASALAGAAAALVVQVARQLTSAPVTLAAAPRGDALEAEATLLVERQAFAVALRAWLDGAAPGPTLDLERLGGLEVELPLIVGSGAGAAQRARRARPGRWLVSRRRLVDRSIAPRSRRDGSPRE